MRRRKIRHIEHIANRGKKLFHYCSPAGDPRLSGNLDYCTACLLDLSVEHSW
jgi:hypothetical protein